ncbi:MAG: DNA topoisomerase IB [Alphaproteobacteria bacterium]|nr:DNA topoisomerase IB [Alphaproteobacteria bacterium]
MHETAGAGEGLEKTSAADLPILRRRCGRGFTYFDGKGRRICDPAQLDRIRKLAIPPAYEEVHIADSERAHLQAVGRDQAGRLQYRYHGDWETVREEQKAEQLVALCAALPRLRRRVRADLALPGVPARKALAGVAMLIDRTHIRIGCEDYVHSGRSRGAATLLKRSIRCREGGRIDVRFRGKGGKMLEFSAKAPLLCRAVPGWLELPGTRLFQYRGDDGRVHRATAAAANAYLRRITDAPVSAKTFRSLAASALALERLAGVEPGPKPTARRRQVKAVMADIAAMLGNTPAVVRKSYVHGRVLEAFEAGLLPDLFDRTRPVRLLARREAALARLFED